MARRNSLLVLFFSFVSVFASLASFGREEKFVSNWVQSGFYEREARIDTLEIKLARLLDDSNGSIIIPIRQGFPYCEPFTGTALERENTEVGGSAKLTGATGLNNGVLQLTNVDSPAQLGYAFIDLPFSSTYGIKVSFEYFIYHPDPNEDAGDGISFFLYDGDIPASEFKIGGIGGSLGYSPHGYSGGGYTDYSGNPISTEGPNGFGGLLGGYLGIGFDVQGNFGNEYERRYGGFNQPDTYYATHPFGTIKPRYPHSVVVRGPQIIAPNEERRNGMPKSYPETGSYPAPFKSYNFVTGKITYDDASTELDVLAGTGSLGREYFVSPEFKLSSPRRVNDCSDDGYRKVFIDFKPINPLDPSAGYQIDVDMLVNNGTTDPALIPILNTSFIPDQTVPASFKLGFAGATGALQAFQEIRNVTAQVSNESQLNKPETLPLERSVCVGEEELFELDVKLSNIDSEIQCIQLYSTEAEAKEVADQLDDIIDDQDCESGICQIEVCTQERLTKVVNTGTFEALLVLENGVEVSKIRFNADQGVTGVSTIWYTVTDNFGQISAPQPITISINPFPKHDNPGGQAIENPSCDGQQDGRISNIIVKDLVDGFDYEWIHNGNSIGQSGASVSSLTNGEASFELTGVNLGTYTLKVWNPSNNVTNGCPVEIDIVVDQEDGTPVVLDVPEKTICEGEPVSFLPAIDPDFNPGGNTPSFLWYQSADKAGGALVSGSTITVNGSPVEVEISAAGELILTGLKHSGTSPTYEFFVEVKSQTNPGGNFCPFLGNIPTKAVARVNPPLNFQVTHTDDWCLLQEGEIQGTATGASDITYSLLDENDQVLASGNTGVFSGLSPGNYQIVGTSASLGCSTPIEEVEIEGPDNPLSIVPVEEVNAYCSQANGSIKFQVSGGILPYQSIVVDGTSIPYDPTGVYSVTGLNANQYAITVTDAEGCTVSSSIEVFADPPSNFTVLGTEVCEGQEGSASIDIHEPSSGTPQFTWYKKDGAGGYAQITDGLVEGDVSYHVSPLAELFVSGLSANVVPYQFFLRVTGDKICDQGYIPAEIKVTPGPEMDPPIVSTTCFGESVGSIQAQIPGTNYADFEFGLIGDNGISIPFSKNDGLFEDLPSGTYELSIKSALGCITSLDGVVVEQPVEPISIVNQPSIERASCNLPNGLIKDLVITGGWGDYTVEWHKDAPDGDIVPGNATGSVDLLSGTYYLSVTDSKGCQATFDFVVEESSDPVYELVPTTNVCEGEQVSIKPIHIAPDPSLPPTAFTEVIWYKEPGQVGAISSGADPGQPGVTYTIDDSDWLNPSLSVDGLEAGTHDFYFYVVCTGQELKAEINVFDVPEVTVTSSPVSCFGSTDGKVTLTSGDSPSYTYVLNGGTAMSQDALEALELLAGDYELEVQTPAGCPQQLSFTVEGPEAPLEMTPLVGVDPGCGAPNGKLQTTISGGWAPYTVTVRDPDNPIQTFTTSEKTVEIDGLVSGFYSIEIIDSENCVIVSPDLQLVDGPTQINLKDQQICEGQAVTLVPNIDPPSADAVYNWYLDAGHTKKITADSSPTTGGIVYDIDSENGELTITGLSGSATAYQYFIEVTGAGVCQNAGQASVMVYNTPTASAEPVDEVCFGEGGTITVNASGGSGKYSYSLDGTPAQESNVFKNVPVGMHTVQVLTPESCKVIVEDIEIKGPDAPLDIKVSEVVNPTCNLSNGELTLQLAGGYSPYSVEIFQNKVSKGKAIPDENGLLVIPAIGSGDYEFTVTDAGGCTVSLNEPLELVEVPTTIQIEDQKICEGEEAVLTPKVPANISKPIFTWFFDESLSTPLTAGSNNGITYSIASDGTLTITDLSSASGPFTYYVMVDGEGICAVIPEKVQVDVSQYPTLRVSNPSIVCDPDGTVDLTDFIEGYNPAVYDYNIISPFGKALVDDELGAVDESGSYEVSVSSKGSSCWTDSKRILVRISEELIQSDFQYHADLGGGNIVSNEVIQLLENVDFEDFSTGDILIWDWDFGDGSTSNEQNPNHIFQNKGSYTISLTTTDSIGCQSVYSVLVEVKDDYLLMMPNAFTPDGVKNQYYKPKHRGIAGLEFHVFTTWGELIYESNSLEDLGWDGTLNGKPAPNGNYAYKVKYQTKSGNEFDEAGVFILIR